MVRQAEDFLLQRGKHQLGHLLSSEADGAHKIRPATRANEQRVSREGLEGFVTCCLVDEKVDDRLGGVAWRVQDLKGVARGEVNNL